MDADTILRELGVQALWQVRGGSHWVEAPGLDTRASARLLRHAEARLVTMTAMPRPEGFRLIYHWDLDGELYNIATTIEGKQVASIADLLPAADWVERELRDYYAIEFLGRDETPTLMLRDGDEAGLFSRTQELGRDRDPAEYEGPDDEADDEGVSQ